MNETYYDGKQGQVVDQFDYYRFVSFGDLINPKFKMVTIPMERNQLFVRLENIWDDFDTAVLAQPLPPSAHVYLVDLKALANYLWEFANDGVHPLDSVLIEEMNLSGNMKYRDI